MLTRLSYAVLAGRTKPQERGACQDAAFGKSSGDTAAVAICDGAGSRKNSGTGARACSRFVVNLLL